MKNKINTFGLLIVVLIAFVVQTPSQTKNNNCSTCSIALSALQDIGKLKQGMSRKDVEANFELDGGWQPRGQSRYIYKNCKYIKINIDFLLDSTVKKNFSPKDTIQTVSEPFIQYPVMD